jgi:hypothetical protein
MTDRFRFWRYADLKERRIVGSRSSLFRLQQEHGFPRGIVLSGGRGSAVIYRVDDVVDWLEKRERLGLVSGPRGDIGQKRKGVRRP